MKVLESFPVCSKLTPTISDLPNQLPGVDLEPEEIQRGEVATKEWGSWVIASIFCGVELPPITWSVQKTTYDIVYKGVKLRCHIKNIDGLQRITQIQLFIDGHISVPDGVIVKWDLNKNYYGEEEIDLSGLSYLDIKEKYPELLQEKFHNYTLRIDKYGGNGQYLSPQQETYLFKQVLNNGNKMNGQQWRNPTVSKIASVIRKDARLNPIDFFNPEILGITNPKMEYDELLADFYHFVIYGLTINLGKKALDEMYDSPLYVKSIDKVQSYNHKYLGKINPQSKVSEITDMMYEIIKDKQYREAVDKALIRSLFYFCWLHLTEFGNQTKWDYKELKKVFFTGHIKLVDISGLPVGVPRTAFGDALVSRGSVYQKRILRHWREELNWTEDINYNED